MALICNSCETDLNPGASEELLRKIEATIGIKLPGSMRDAYKEHNGEVEGAGGYMKGKPLDSFFSLLPLTESSCLLNNMIKEEEWTGGVTMFAGPPPVDEKMELPDEFFKESVEPEMKLFPISVRRAPVEGAVIFKAIDCMNGTIIDVTIDTVNHRLTLRPMAPDFTSFMIQGDKPECVIQ